MDLTGEHVVLTNGKTVKTNDEIKSIEPICLGDPENLVIWPHVK